ncbi:ABC transporter substrate-binding protein [Shinella sp. BYT-45]|uniref:ABC transporter substrate-binding protein n=1 Tax=Shinella sp. BYT-45 TaxID=3377377 RepID=UPI00397F32EC
MAWLGGVLATAGGARAAPAPRRIVALDAPSTEMLTTLGIAPAGVAGLDGYRKVEGDLPLLRHAVDVGFYYEPNLEMLQALKPDVMVRSFGIGPSVELLERIAPVISAPVYGVAGSTEEGAASSFRQIAGLTGTGAAAEAFLAAHRSRLDRLAAQVAARRLRPVFLASPLLDGRHVILYGRNSLFDGVMRRVGLRNAYGGETSPWGIASKGIDSLAGMPDGVFLYIESPIAKTAIGTLEKSAIWRSLPFVRAARVLPVPYLEMYGALPTAHRFAGIVDGLIDRGALDAG